MFPQVSFGTEAYFHFDLNDHNTINEVMFAIQSIPWKDEMTNTSGENNLEKFFRKEFFVDSVCNGSKSQLKSQHG